MGGRQRTPSRRREAEPDNGMNGIAVQGIAVGSSRACDPPMAKPFVVEMDRADCETTARQVACGLRRREIARFMSLRSNVVVVRVVTMCDYFFFIEPRCT